MKEIGWVSTKYLNFVENLKFYVNILLENISRDFKLLMSFLKLYENTHNNEE